MADPVYTNAQIVTLREAIASGATKVSYSDKTVEYRSLSEMKEILATMEAEFADPGVARRRHFRSVTVADKGL